MSEPRAGGYREPLAGESLDEYEAALAAAEDEVVAAIWRATLRGALGPTTTTPDDDPADLPDAPTGAGAGLPDAPTTHDDADPAGTPTTGEDA